MPWSRCHAGDFSAFASPLHAQQGRSSPPSRNELQICLTPNCCLSCHHLMLPRCHRDMSLATNANLGTRQEEGQEDPPHIQETMHSDSSSSCTLSECQGNTMAAVLTLHDESGRHSVGCFPVVIRVEQLASPKIPAYLDMDIVPTAELFLFINYVTLLTE